MDMDDVKFGCGFLLFLGSIFAIIFAVSLPIVYLDGQAKSKWIKQTRGVDIPWYEAVHLKVEINSVDGQISSR